ncbi:L-threonylcarbamoyladenylate synthase [Halomicrobium zhouii]|uniref:L-threonylcarbamoyladenylate synthase n=1 Tax=Halomicrobium zhouii TaxID=767519 RepID=A0A1I6KAR4_9EURY|nr:L-threonylcarbamoyladenylate synthase [Halomicrobium zhouii]SFR88277.1 L-threonylcarbamoyladenylate synthase [Halomicrobium zhouii]
MTEIERAARAVEDGDLVVYPTETVYGLGADALDPDAVERVFAAKGRDPDDPLSLGVPDVDTALEYTNPTEREERFMRAFLPGPVTVVVERGDQVPDELTGGRDRVGIRVPEHELARDLLAAAGPLTATSANVSGEGSVRRVADLDDEIREAAAVVLDGGETLGAESTVVDVGEEEILRDGGMVTAVQMWLRSN